MSSGSVQIQLSDDISVVVVEEEVRQGTQVKWKYKDTRCFGIPMLKQMKVTMLKTWKLSECHVVLNHGY